MEIKFRMAAAAPIWNKKVQEVVIVSWARRSQHAGEGEKNISGHYRQVSKAWRNSKT